MTVNFLYNFVKKYNISKSLFVTYCTTLTAILYFIFFILFGQKGLVELFSLKKQIENKEIIKQNLSAKMQTKKNMVDGMNTDSLDVDLLDEQARKTLGYTGKNEVVIVPDFEKKE